VRAPIRPDASSPDRAGARCARPCGVHRPGIGQRCGVAYWAWHMVSRSLAGARRSPPVPPRTGSGGGRYT